MNHPSTPLAETSKAPLAGEARGMRRGIFRLLGMLVLGAVLFAVYYPASHGEFIFDDSVSVVDNRSIRQLWPPAGSGENVGPLNPPKSSPAHGRPLVNVAFAVNYHFCGLDPFGYRIVHIPVHLLTAMLLWAIVARTLRLECFRGRFDRFAEPLAFAATLVWALHPLQTESVVYITQRTELMMGFFYLATLYSSMRCWAARRAAGRTAWLLVAALACVSGMLSKEMMASAPAMVLLYERTFITGSYRRALARSWVLYVGLGLGWLPLIALNFNGPRTPGAGFGKGATALEWWFTQTEVLFLYLKLTFWPWPLVIHYEIPYLKTVAAARPWLVATGFLVVAAIVLHWRRWAAGFVAIWFFAVLSPTLVVPLVSETVAERRMYIPLAAIVPLVMIGGYELLERAARALARRAGKESAGRVSFAVFSLATVGLAIGFATISSHRLAVYGDEFSLWQDSVLRQPDNPLIHVNLGTMLAERGRLPEAIVHLREAVRLAPAPEDSPLRYAEEMRYRAHFNLARALESSGQTREAVEEYRTTLKLRPTDAVTHYSLARVLENSGRVQEAIVHYRQAAQAQPDMPAVHCNLGIALLNTGRLPEAIASFETALRQQDDLANNLNLATAYSMAGRAADAIPLAEKALDLARSQHETALVERLEANLAQLRTQIPSP